MQMANIPNLMPALPEIVIALGVLTLLMLGVFVKRTNIVRTISYACIILLLVAIPLMSSSSEELASTFGVVFIVDNYTLYIKTFILLSASAVILISKNYIEMQAIEFFEFPILIILEPLGKMMMVS